MKLLPVIIPTLFLFSCSSGEVTLRQGMPKAGVERVTGKPLRVIRAIDGTEDWLVRVEHETVTTESDDNLPASGESVFRRDERMAAQGISSSTTTTTTRHRAERWISFDADGTLSREYRDQWDSQ